MASFTVAHIMTLFVAPLSVTELVAEVLSSSSIRVRWSSPECPYGVITNYTVFYRQADTPQTGDIDSTGYITDTVDSSVEEYVISGLASYIYYAIHVQAVNGGGTLPGEITLEVVKRTEEAGEFNGHNNCNSHHRSLLLAPASPPDNVATNSVSSTEISVTWDIVPLINQNGVITMYEVLYQPLETFNGAIRDLTVMVSASEMSVVLMNLQEYVNYAISIRAYTSVGGGPYSEAIVELTNENGK